MNLFLMIGLAVFTGIVGGKLAERAGVPELIGTVLVGLVFGESVLGFFQAHTLDSLKPIVDLALAFFGFFIGAELKVSELRGMGREIVSILFSEALLTFAVVSAGVYLYTRQLHMALLFGALATSTAPAATADVLWEYRAKGKLTTTIMAMVGLDDAVAILVFSLANYLAIREITGTAAELSAFIGFFFHEVGFAVALGAVMGLLLVASVRLLQKTRDIFLVAIGCVIMCSGLAEYLEASEVLSNMIVGLVFSNLCVKAESSLYTVRELTSPLFTLFFVLTGARLNVFLLTELGVMGLIYLGARVTGKTLGASFGAWASKAAEPVRRYIGFCLYSQAGLTIGLSSYLYHELSELGELAAKVGLSILNTIVATSLVLLMFGPLCLKYAVTKAGEVEAIKREELVFEY